MKFIYFSIFLIFPLALSGQHNSDRKYYDENWAKSDSVHAKYYSDVSYTDKKQKAGTVNTYFVNGKIKSEEQYSNVNKEYLEGESKFYFENGLLESSSFYSINKKNGEYRKFYETGQLRRFENYKKGKFISGQCYTLEGNDTTFFPESVFPEFPGGETALVKYLSKNIKYPKQARSPEIYGTVFISFVIDEYGNVKDVKLLKSVHELLDAEAIRVVTQMPQWSPGYEEGLPVSVSFNLPIGFNMGEKK